ncbi:MAG: DHH family phosphoesterase [Firmicutes bacterium]|nr:DHH family phosphoesterase [Bacillota bacterium]
MKPNSSYYGLLPLILLAVCAAVTVVTGFFNTTAFLIELIAVLVLAVLVIYYYLRRQKHMREYMRRIIKSVSGRSRVLSDLDMPVMIAHGRSVVWYNPAFRIKVLSGHDCIGDDCGRILGAENASRRSGEVFDVQFGNRLFAVNVCAAGDDSCIYFFSDMTELDNVKQSYSDIRPAVGYIVVDNLDDLLRDVKDSECAQISGTIEQKIENWAAEMGGLCRKLSSDRFLMVTDEKHLKTAIDKRFDILSTIKTVSFGERGNATLSIGVGHDGGSFAECEELARQALDMALGRGGDQAAVKDKKDFLLFGGTQSTQTKRSRVRTRVVASSLKKLIESSDSVFIMGHRFADLDCFGSSVGLYQAVRSMGKPAKIVITAQQALCGNLIDYVQENGFDGCVIDPHEAIGKMTKRTLLIVTDTHRRNFVDSPELFDRAETTVIIDHHRKTVDCIDSAIIFYHEPYASSASEMVSELLPYLGSKVGRIGAEALLAGIMLDTRNFVLHTGVRTFEASAYLRSCGANPVTVKQFFRGSINTYKEKSSIISSACLYGDCAISVCEDQGEDVRISSAQAADELLNIDGVNGSFVVFVASGVTNISARSYGAINVQLIMEQLGGGGHLTMAAAQLNEEPEIVLKKLYSAIDNYKANIVK